MNAPEEAEAAAFIAWLSTFPLKHPVASISDLKDGLALYDVLGTVYVIFDGENVKYFGSSLVLCRDPSHFRQSASSHSSVTALQLADNWPLRFTSLKRLFRLITTYFVDYLNQSSSAVKNLEVPDLQKVARDGDLGNTLALCRLCIAIAVMSSRNQDVIAGIQTLEEAHQQRLMEAIALVMSRLEPNEGDPDANQMTE